MDGETNVPTAIAVTSADLVLPPTDQQTPTAALLQAPDAQPLEAALVDMSVMLERHGYVVAVYPASLPAAHEHRLHTVRSMLETDRLALLKLDLPPLAIGVLVRQLRQLSICDFSAGVVASAARLLSHYIYAGALLNSVTKLDRVPVSLKSHAKSWMPGTQFGVLTNPNPELIRIGSGGTGAGAGAGAGLTGPEVLHQLFVGKGNLVSDWVTGTLAPRLAGPGCPGDRAARRLPALVGHGEDDRIRCFPAGHIGPLPAGGVRTARALPLVRDRTHR